MLPMSHTPYDPRPALIFLLLPNLVISNSKLALKFSEIFKDDKLLVFAMVYPANCF